MNALTAQVSSSVPATVGGVLGPPQQWRRDFAIAGATIGASSIGLYLLEGRGTVYLPMYLAQTVVLAVTVGAIGPQVRDWLDSMRGKRSLPLIAVHMVLSGALLGVVAIGLPAGLVSFVADQVIVSTHHPEHVSTLIERIHWLGVHLRNALPDGAIVGAVLLGLLWFPYVWLRVLQRTPWPAAAMVGLLVPLLLLLV